ncbi:MAG: SMC-Scp complex subunit ScpB [Clostridiales bacterium]|jgi:segregation and condensation protein B|nr:SMC-Scp complex subunit ScpB [Clostridiales bacterium]
MENIQYAIESVLFASGEPIELSTLADALNIDLPRLEFAIDALSNEYDYSKRGIKINRLGNKVQMSTREDYAEFVKNLVRPQTKRPLSSAMLEVLAIVAYKQPITKPMIERIRGLDSAYSIMKLLEMGLVDELGQAEDLPGRPMKYGTSDTFLLQFGLNNLSDLPELSSLPTMEENL